MTVPSWLRSQTASLALVGLGAVLLAAILAGAIPGWRPDPVDARAYWLADPSDPYGGKPVGAEAGFYYSPAFAQLIEPIAALPWDWFVVVWRALPVVALIGVGAGPAIAFPGVLEDVVRGNINTLLALAVVAGFRHPALWAVVLLTKVTPGIGLVWFAVRRDWARLGVALGATVAVIALSVALGGPELWREWIATLVGSADGLRTYAYLGVDVPPLWIRLPAAAAVVAWGGLTDRRWTVPLAAMLALPVLWPSGFAMLVGVLLLTRPPFNRRGAGLRMPAQLSRSPAGSAEAPPASET
jgi:hypothetical protein